MQAAPAVSGTIPMTPLQRDILKVEKKLREIEQLTRRRDAGEALDKLQDQKLVKEAELRSILGQLQQEKLVVSAQEPEKKAVVTPAEVLEQDAREPVEVKAKRASFSEELPETIEVPIDERVRFDAANFEGDWLDNLGHRLIVKPGTSRRGRGGRRVTYTYVAAVYTEGVFSRQLAITWDVNEKEWRCGNGLFVRSESDASSLTWLSEKVGRTHWSKTPPNDSIYFDAPPEAQAYFNPVGDAVDGCWAEGGWQEGSEWWMQGDWSQWAQFEQQSEGASFDGAGFAQVPIAHGPPGLGDEDQAVGAADATFLEVKFPVSAKTAAKARTKPEPVESPPIFLEAASGNVEGIQVAGNRLDWVLSEVWEQLWSIPRDDFVSSLSFSVEGSLGMTLQFYPNGQKASDAGCCTVELVRASENNSGLKFEVLLNGRTSRPKACLGKRFLAHFPRPFEESKENGAKRVKISMLVLSVF